jgi:hypothetical protein
MLKLLQIQYSKTPGDVMAEIDKLILKKAHEN